MNKWILRAALVFMVASAITISATFISGYIDGGKITIEINHYGEGLIELIVSSIALIIIIISQKDLTKMIECKQNI